MNDDLAELRAKLANLTEALDGMKKRDKQLVALLEGAREDLENIRDAGSSDYSPPQFYQWADAGLRRLLGGSVVKCKQCERIVAPYDSVVGGCWRCRNAPAKGEA